MNIRRRKQSAFLAVATTAIALTASEFSSMAFGDDLRCARQETAATSEGSQPVLARLRTECPLLAGIIEQFVAQDLGEESPSETVKSHSREIAVVAAFAALADIASMKRHAQYARDAGATTLEFKKMLYLTAVHAGVSKAIEATRALSDVFTERDVQCSDRPLRVENQHF